MAWMPHPSFPPARDRILEGFRRGAFLFQRLRPVIFLCGGKDSYNRMILRQYLLRRHPELLVFFAEDVWVHVAKRRTLNALQMEEQLALLADMVAIITKADIYLKASDADRKKAKEAKEAARNNIRMMMGDAVGATLPDGTTFTYKTVSRKGYVVQPKQSRQLRMKRGRKSV